jgi:hypothetical protein
MNETHFESLSEEDRAMWRSDPVTRAFLQRLKEMAADAGENVYSALAGGEVQVATHNSGFVQGLRSAIQTLGGK